MISIRQIMMLSVLFGMSIVFGVLSWYGAEVLNIGCKFEGGRCPISEVAR